MVAMTPQTFEKDIAGREPGGYLLYVGARQRPKNVEVLLRALAAMPAGSRPPPLHSGARWHPDLPPAAAGGRPRWRR